MKNLNVKKLFFFFNLRFFSFVKTSPTRRIKYKLIDFAPINKSIMTFNLPQTNLEQFLRRIKSRLRVNSAKCLALLTRKRNLRY